VQRHQPVVIEFDAEMKKGQAYFCEKVACPFGRKSGVRFAWLHNRGWQFNFMARKPRINYPGALYRVTLHGNDRRISFTTMKIVIASSYFFRKHWSVTTIASRAKNDIRLAETKKNLLDFIISCNNPSQPPPPDRDNTLILFIIKRT
jgi:hypothetical protein